MTIKLTNIFVNNPKEAYEFYTTILGFKSLMFVEAANLAIIVSPEDEKGTALLLEPNDSELAKTYQEALYKKSLPAIILGSNDVNKEYERLSSLGVHFKTRPVENNYGVSALFDDGCGNYIQIHQN